MNYGLQDIIVTAKLVLYSCYFEKKDWEFNQHEPD